MAVETSRAFVAGYVPRHGIAVATIDMADTRTLLIRESKAIAISPLSFFIVGHSRQ